MNKDELKTEYLSGKSSIILAKQYGVSKKTILNCLHSLPDWDIVKKEAHAKFLHIKSNKNLHILICEFCKSKFENKRKSKFCSVRCRKLCWQKKYRSENSTEINELRREKNKLREKKLNNKNLWSIKFKDKVSTVHKKNLDKIVNKLLKRSESVKNSMVTRSKKMSVLCDITIEEIRQMIYDNYGKKCKYCDKILTINTMVFDHIHPISKGGNSTRTNIQIICKTSNSMKGSLDEDSFTILLNWLDTISPELKKDISIRLSRGIH